jgi:hypothetical protein
MDAAAYAISRGYNILTAEFNQALFQRRISKISHDMENNSKNDSTNDNNSTMGSISRQSSVSWSDWMKSSKDEIE